MRLSKVIFVQEPLQKKSIIQSCANWIPNVFYIRVHLEIQIHLLLPHYHENIMNLLGKPYKNVENKYYIIVSGW